MTWTPDADQRLLTLRQEHPEASARTLAQRMGEGFTKDQIQKRLRRLKDFDSRPPEPEAEAGFVMPEPEDGFIGLRIAYWGLETTGLTAIMGRVLCCSFADSWGNVTTFRYEDYPGESIIDDGPLCVAIRDELEKAGHWVTWDGKLYDVPMLNARLLKAGERPLRKDILHTDLMYYARGQFVRIGSSKLVNVSEFVQSPNRKAPLEWSTWQLAATGDRDAMDLVVEHAEADVLVTRDVFAVLSPHLTVIHR